MKHHSQISFDYKCIVNSYIIFMSIIHKPLHLNKLKTKLLKSHYFLSYL